MFKEIGNKTAANIKNILIEGEYIFIENMQSILREWNKNYRCKDNNQLEFNFGEQYRGGCPTCE